MASRSVWYLGAGGSCTPDDLDWLEASGEYAAEPKFDGMFVSLHVGATRTEFRSRDTGEGRLFIPGEARYDGMDRFTLPDTGAVVLGELEAATEAATILVKQRGYRKVYVHDMIAGEGGACMREWPWEMRRARLEEWYAGLSLEQQRQIELSPLIPSAWRATFDWMAQSGGEGLIVKKKDSTASGALADGKTPYFMKCKVEKTFDYVLLGERLTEKLKERSGRLGLWDPTREEFRPCLTCRVPEELLVPENYGKVVIEVVAFQRFKSGSARSARFVRVRSDREPTGVTASQVG